MPVTFTRVLVAIAVVVAIFVLLRAFPRLSENRGVSAPAPVSGAAAPAPAVTAQSPVRTAHDAAQPTTALPAVAAASTVTPIHFAVSAPSTVSVLDPFDAGVDIAAPAGVHRLRFAVTYDRKTLELTGVSEGDLARRGGPRVDLVTDEPSDGNAVVTLTVRDGPPLTGAGTVAVLHFQPRRSGTVGIAVRNLTAFDTANAVRFHADAPQSATV